MEKIEDFCVKQCWGNSVFDYVYSEAVGNSGGKWEVKVKEYDDYWVCMSSKRVKKNKLFGIFFVSRPSFGCGDIWSKGSMWSSFLRKGLSLSMVVNPLEFQYGRGLKQDVVDAGMFMSSRAGDQIPDVLFLTAPFVYLGSYVGWGHPMKPTLWSQCYQGYHGANGKIDEKKTWNGLSTLFWDDVWCDGGKLKNRFPRAYALENSKQITVGQKLAHPSLYHSFRRHPERRALELNQVKS
ncbi:hypothetical protein Tco_0527626 [Tanacetum coccineum]